MYVYFTPDDLSSLDSLRQAYRKQAIALHPDKHEDDLELWHRKFILMQAEYESALSGISRSEYKSNKTTYNRERVLQDMIDRLMRVPKIEIDLAGCWLWVTCEGWTSRFRLMRLGFRWSKQKRSWYWGLTMKASRGRRIKPRFATTQEVFNFYGREHIGSSTTIERLLLTREQSKNGSK